MLFNSLHFFVFFAVVTMTFFSLPARMRWPFVLAASCYFYMVFVPVYILILGVTIGVDYISARLIEQAMGRARRLLLLASIVANIGVLAIFKYYDFFTDNLVALASLIGWRFPIQHLGILLPIGLSFHTFQSLSYTIEVYRGRQLAERRLWRLALYVMFYPQLVAGPIERPQNLLHQFHEEVTLDYDRITNGLKLIAIGLFRKAVIADRLAVPVNAVFSNPHHYDGLGHAIATVLFALQIYCDFAGYSAIAIGCAQVMGVRLMDNFRRPYAATSIAEFWQRWHISLSTWFRDYVYIPLGGNRVRRSRHLTNLMVTFLLSGLWHGASWTYVVWGGLHGAYLLVSLATARWRAAIAARLHLNRAPALRNTLAWAMTFVGVCIAWVFFRASTIEDAIFMLGRMGRDIPSAFAQVARSGSVSLPGVGLLGTIPALVAFALVEVVDIQDHPTAFRRLFVGSPVALRWAIYYGLVLSVVLWGRFGVQQFIYFQF